MPPFLRTTSFALVAVIGVLGVFSGGCGSVVVMGDDDTGGQTMSAGSSSGTDSTGAGSSGTGNNGLRTGRFGDGPVSGVRYESESQSGETNAAGEFRYVAGESVQFFVGDIVLGEAAGADRVSVFDLAGIDAPVTAPDVKRAQNRLVSNPRAIPFDRVINLSVFLQTLDADADPTNGVQLPPECHDAATGYELSFNQKYATFVESFALRQFVGAVRSLTVWTLPRPIRSPAGALDSLYAGLELTPIIGARRKFEEDLANNGHINQRRTYAHTAAGRLSSVVYENITTTATTTSSSAFQFDEHGRTVSGQGFDFNGVLSSEALYTYDAMGNQTQLLIKQYGEFERRSDFTYDENGSVLSMIAETTNGMYREEYRYDARGNRTVLERFIGFDTPAVYREQFTYDGNDHLILKEVDSQADGTIDSRERYLHDLDGHLLLFEPLNPDGEATFRESYTYDNQGNLILFERAPNATDVKMRQSYAYDGEGNMTLQETGGATNVGYRTVHAYDAIGNVMTSEFQNVNHPQNTSTRSYAYDSNGQAVTVLHLGSEGYNVRYLFQFEKATRWAAAFETRW